MTFEIAARRSGYKINVDNINISLKENDPIGYTFNVKVTYWKENEIKYTTKIFGNAQCKEGKISYFNYTDNGGLLENMR